MAYFVKLDDKQNIRDCIDLICFHNSVVCKSSFTFLPKEIRFVPLHDKTNKMICAPGKDSDQPGHLPSLIRVFTVRSMGS